MMSHSRPHTGEMWQRLADRLLRRKRSIGARIFGALIAMSLIIGMLGTYGFLVLSTASGFVVATYDGPLVAIDYARSASFAFAQMDKERLRRELVAVDQRAAIDNRIEQLTKTFFDDLAVADERSLSSDERAIIEQIRIMVSAWNELRLSKAEHGAAGDLDPLAEKIAERFELLIEKTIDHSFVERRKAVSAVANFKYTTVAATALALLLATAMALFLARRIITPLSAAASSADRIANGELETPIPTGGNDETGTLLRSMTIMRDNIRAMVEREQGQRRSAQNRLFHALESSNEAMVLVDARGKIALANSQLAAHFPLVTREIGADADFTEVFSEIGKRFVTSIAATSDGVGGERTPTWDELLSIGGEFQITDGRWLRISRSNTQDGGFFIVFSDFTEIKEREEHLSLAKRQAEAASAAKSNFLANMSHELRTPLNAIIGFSEIFRDQLFGELGNSKYREYAGNILESGRHLLAIINGLLDLAKSDAGKLQLDAEPLDLRTIIDGCATMMREQCLRGQLQLNVEHGEDELIVWGDAAKLRQILLNLLSNAVKFTEPGGRVSIAATADRDTITCRVADNGIGMAPEDIPVALTPFSQIDSRLARRYAGTGLGLPLTKALVNLHGGTMTIDSAPNRGTTVTVTLQRFSAADQPKRQAASA